jgi:hypothetical protein
MSAARELRPPIGHRSGYPPNPPEAIWGNYEVNLGGCWVWTRSLDRYGYGQFSYYGYSGHRAHVVSWLLTHGPITGGLVINHLCANRACINPEHLELLTSVQNVLDGVSRRARKITCLRGHTGRYKERTVARGRYCMECDRLKHRKDWTDVSSE